MKGGARAIVAISQDTDGIAKSGEAAATATAIKKPRPGVSDILAGEAADFVRDLKPYLPQEMVGGSLPHIPGTEDEAVWNAASQACGTEKVHFCYTIDEGKIFFLACPSAMLASNPNSWCPLAAALPGNSEYWDHETVYLYEQEGIATALRWDPETDRMQVFLGASRTILPRVQSMDANFVTINPAVADIVPWKNMNLRTEKLSRATARMLVLTGMMVSLAAIIILLYNYIAINMIERNLESVQAETQRASSDLMLNAYNAMQSDTIRHMVRIQELLDQLSQFDGTLVRYEVRSGSVEWEALIPEAFVSRFSGAQPIGIDEEDARKRIRIKGSR